MKNIKNLNTVRIIHKILPALTICILGMIVYSNSLDIPFHFDDQLFIVNNPTIRNLSDSGQIFKSLLPQRSRFVAFYSFALNYHFYKLDVFGYHVTNLIIHIVSSLLVWRLALLLISAPSVKDDKAFENKDLIAFFAALLFVSHPVQTQAIVYITQRFASLATLFYLLSVFLYLKARLIGENTKARLGCFIASGIAALMGMFTKEITITIPITIMFIEGMLFGSKGKKENLLIYLRSNKRWLYLLILLSFMLIIPKLFDFTVVNQLFTPKQSNSHDGDIITFGRYVLTQFRVAVTFIKLLFVPIGQNVDYDFALSKSLLDLATMFSFIAFFLIFSVGIMLKKRNVLASFGILWVYITFLPNFIPRSDLIFEHKLYLISFGFCFLLATIVFKRFQSKRTGVIFLCIIIFTYSVLTYQRNKIWSSEVSLWSDAAKKSPYKSRALNNLGFSYLKQKEFDLAFQYFNKVIKHNPTFVRSYDNRGTVYHQWNKNELALSDFNKAIELNPSFARAYYNRANLYRDEKKYDLAIQDYSKAIDLQNNYTLAYNNRGNVYSFKGEYDLAVLDYNKVLELNPGFLRAYNNRGAVYIATKQYDLALKDLNRIINLEPKRAKAYYNRSYVYRVKKQYKKALDDAIKAKELGQAISDEYIEELRNYILGSE
ncbi:MAG: tetratricopeptide repeat protein [Candidatus Omnitrophica bacterium]|nr:tetratricopeptide repeat protein [Candidatus Omnitrophota bacterium]MBU1996638.1 tetratricopeptide repeat protein [Candidatus Omnitrophota bacterium]MBU4333150.1 tetratricopeptide repeat protein [Candidatus Omnitrophota bacterium]